ncbi:MAG TPA: prepilin-type N-terminal cleavage/methylation domain-containing protein [Chthoniobacteraceae bacterium]|jgi:prepilin-type N-terminal cleavage/methylation domain-containing protein|nr:prepilin-type N-terminal cleavage/methylation domain-containing protein [Chthoniobacteraceae bacterium]
MRAFTLLEVMIAVLIISMLVISVFRFVKSVLQAVQISTDATVSKQEVAGLLSYLQTQLEDLPVQQAMPASGFVINGPGTLQLGGNNTLRSGDGTAAIGGQGGTNGPVTGPSAAVMQLNTLTGISHKYHDLPADEMEWVCAAGPGVLTTSGEDQYRVTLAIQNVKGKSNEYEIGLRRRPVEADEKNYNWLPLLRPAAALEIRYFEPRGKQWIDAWKEPILKPSLVRVRVWRSKDEPPMEAVFALPAARLQGL